jgi:hypothetical protein
VRTEGGQVLTMKNSKKRNGGKREIKKENRLKDKKGK